MAIAVTAAASQLASVVALSSAQQLSSGSSSASASASAVAWRRKDAESTTVPAIECAHHPQKKATAHHNKSRPKKHQPYDKNRKGPTYYPPLEKLPPIWGLDTADALAALGAPAEAEASAA